MSHNAVVRKFAFKTMGIVKATTETTFCGKQANGQLPGPELE